LLFVALSLLFGIELGPPGGRVTASEAWNAALLWGGS
jgi:hypothetical protein